MLTLLIALLVCFALMFLLGREHALDEANEGDGGDGVVVVGDTEPGGQGLGFVTRSEVVRVTTPGSSGSRDRHPSAR